MLAPPRSVFKSNLYLFERRLPGVCQLQSRTVVCIYLPPYHVRGTSILTANDHLLQVIPRGMVGVLLQKRRRGRLKVTDRNVDFLRRCIYGYLYIA